MDESYGKVFVSTYTGSMYGAGMHVHAVWPWILAHADEHGIVEINPDVVGDQLDKCCATVAQHVRTAVEYLMQPDPSSRSQEEGGRRLVHVSGFTYRVVNKEKYRDRGGDRTAYWRDYRAKKRGQRNSCATVAQHAQQLRATKSTQAEAKALPPISPKGDGGRRLGASPLQESDPETERIIREHDQAVARADEQKRIIAANLSTSGTPVVGGG